MYNVVAGPATGVGFPGGRKSAGQKARPSRVKRITPSQLHYVSNRIASQPHDLPN